MENKKTAFQERAYLFNILEVFCFHLFHLHWDNIYWETPLYLAWYRTNAAHTQQTGKRQNKYCIDTHHSQTQSLRIFRNENNFEHCDISVYTFNNSDGILDEFKTLLHQSLELDRRVTWTKHHFWARSWGENYWYFNGCESSPGCCCW